MKDTKGGMGDTIFKNEERPGPKKAVNVVSLTVEAIIDDMLGFGRETGYRAFTRAELVFSLATLRHPSSLFKMMIPKVLKPRDPQDHQFFMRLMQKSEIDLNGCWISNSRGACRIYDDALKKQVNLFPVLLEVVGRAGIPGRIVTRERCNNSRCISPFCLLSVNPTPLNQSSPEQ